ncbi:hypothetical protein BH23DEI1_BH23DEI1_17260 [soil metagenome]
MRPRITLDEAFARHGSSGRSAAAATDIELLDGVLVRRPRPSAAVVATVVRIASELDRYTHALDLDVRGALACPPHDLLRPEVTLRRVVPPHKRRPAPGPDTVVLAILVGDDEGETAWRARRCAAVGIEELWTLSPGDGHAVRLSAPRGGVYSARDLILPGERVAVAAAPSVVIAPVARTLAFGPHSSPTGTRR